MSKLQNILEDAERSIQKLGWQKTAPTARDSRVTYDLAVRLSTPPMGADSGLTQNSFVNGYVTCAKQHLCDNLFSLFAAAQNREVSLSNTCSVRMTVVNDRLVPMKQAVRVSHTFLRCKLVTPIG